MGSHSPWGLLSQHPSAVSKVPIESCIVDTPLSLKVPYVPSHFELDILDASGPVCDPNDMIQRSTESSTSFKCLTGSSSRGLGVRAKRCQLRKGKGIDAIQSIYMILNGHILDIYTVYILHISK